MVRVKRSIIIVLLSLFCVVGTAVAETDVSVGIEAYQAGKYQQCIETMKNIVKNDPASVVSYYYLGLSYMKTGQDLLAVQNFNKVINLNSDSTLTKLARQGKAAIANSAKIETQLNDITEDIKETVEEEYNPILEDGGVNNGAGANNANNNENPKRVESASVQSQSGGGSKVIKASDYAKANPQAVNNPNAQPTNDEIVNAIRTLQKAGLLQNGAAGLVNGQNAMPMQMPMDPRTQQMNSMLMMMNNGNGNNNMMNMMPYMNNGGKIDPQLMQMMLMNQMMPNFSGGNNNGGGY
ncbi:MAG: tetratricopeptide repeat protein [Cyanobacteria bacterium RUI128]|nr:tetratricopeptide repeat protein [Cyanobacteria bacterium RUI128]